MEWFGASYCAMSLLLPWLTIVERFVRIGREVFSLININADEEIYWWLPPEQFTTNGANDVSENYAMFQHRTRGSPVPDLASGNERYTTTRPWYSRSSRMSR